MLERKRKLLINPNRTVQDKVPYLRIRIPENLIIRF